MIQNVSDSHSPHFPQALLYEVGQAFSLVNWNGLAFDLEGGNKRAAEAQSDHYS